MIGVLFASIGTFFEEIASVTGRSRVRANEHSVATMGFLQTFGATIFFGLLVTLHRESFLFSPASLPTYGVRVLLEILQAQMTMMAIVLADRSTYGFLRIMTIPLLVIMDAVLGYTMSFFQYAGIGLILVALGVLFSGKSTTNDARGRWFTIITALNAVATITLFKYNVTHYNSVAAEQLPIYLILLLYFFLTARLLAHENPLSLFRHPAVLVQVASQGCAGVLQSFAILFAPAAVILAAKRSSSALWALMAGRRYFHEQHVVKKSMILVLLVGAIVLLTL